MRSRTLKIAAILLCGVSLTLASVIGGNAQDKGGNPSGDSKKTLTPIVQGTSVCGECHRRDKLPSDKDLPKLCRCNERDFWEKNDKHQDAFEVLTSVRANSINALINPNTKPIEDPSCLGCHSMQSERYEKSLTDEQQKLDYRSELKQGVTCISCHGAVKEWILPHGSDLKADRVNWRKWSRKAKEENFGMRDLWDPAKRSETCLSCHVGDSDPNNHRVITHDMYAAGHPPLPSFEVATFCNSLPRHWELMREKSGQLQKEAYHWNSKELEQTKLVIVGFAASLRDSMKLLAVQAETALKASDAEHKNVDFAQFDCAACHHDLKNPSWRQKRGSEGPPGRPRVKPWSSALLNLCIWQAGATDEERTKLAAEWKTKSAELQTAFQDRPFGDPAKLAKAARGLATWIDEKLIKPLNPDTDLKVAEATRFDKKAAVALLKQLAQDIASAPESQVMDYDEARQTAWAFRAIYEEVHAVLNENTEPQNDSVRTTLLDNHTAITNQLSRLDASLNLNLPNAPAPFAESNDSKDRGKEPATQAQRLAQLKEFLPLVLRGAAEYDPEAFRRTFAELVKLLP
jgi:hypothetical protein